MTKSSTQSSLAPASAAPAGAALEYESDVAATAHYLCWAGLWTVGLTPMSAEQRAKKLQRYRWQSERSGEIPTNGEGLGVVTGMPLPGEDLAIVSIDGDKLGAIAALETTLGKLPATLGARTGREGGGEQRYFWVPADQVPQNSVGNNGGLAPDVDVRGRGGLIAVPPTRHYTGRQYAWQWGDTTDVKPYDPILEGVPSEDLCALIADLPETWLAAMKKTKPAPATREWSDGESDGEGAPEGGEEHLGDEISQEYVTQIPSWFHAKLCALSTTKEGRNDALNGAAFWAGRRAEWLPTAREQLLAAAGRNGYVAEDGEQAARATIESGWRSGQARPYKLVEIAPAAPAPAAIAPVPDALDLGQDLAVNAIIAALAAPTVGVFQRSGALCTVTREAVDTGDVVRPVGAPTIRELAPARLREIIRTRCGARDVPLAAEVAARGEWQHIRPLDAIVTYPIMRRDGTLLLTSGYDAPTRTLADIDVQVTVPDAPDRAAATAALATLTELVADFPFANGGARSAWLAMLLTVPARPAINGPTPLGLLDATARGSGKSKLADVISVVATGREAPRRVAPKTKEEWDKTLFTILLAGDPVVLLDNVTHMLSSDALDAVLTGDTFTQRVLGVSEERRVAIRTVFLASANNARLSSDLVRRSVACRLEPNVERPEERTGFRHPDLLGYVREHRVVLLGAALTVLRAYAVAGRPPVATRPMGSYESWCRVVRDAMVWAGGSDPASTQDGLRESSDVERDELRDLLTAWHAALGEKAVTVRTVLETARDYRGDANVLGDALRGITPDGREPTAHSVGNKLRSFRGQIIGGLVLREGKRESSGHNRSATWQVVRCG